MLGAACDMQIFLGGQKVGIMGTSEKLQLFLEPKDYVLGAYPGMCGGGLVETKVILHTNETKFYRVAHDASGSIILSRSTPTKLD